ncbi:unnamed protein product [Ixodes pacificus]
MKHDQRSDGLHGFLMVFSACGACMGTGQKGQQKRVHFMLTFVLRFLCCVQPSSFSGIGRFANTMFEVLPNFWSHVNTESQERLLEKIGSCWLGQRFPDQRHCECIVFILIRPSRGFSLFYLVLFNSRRLVPN